jgi:hypothetical protein
MLSKILKDRPGVVPVDIIRTWFERIIAESSSFNLPLDRTDDGMAYKSAAVQQFFLGFGIGIRHAERMKQAGLSIDDFSTPTA